jgi:DNA-binding XRE family transcriptional regulator
MMTLMQYLEAEKITQATFAETVGTTQGTVSKLCSGRRPSWSLALKIEQVTGGRVPVSVWASIDADQAGAA